MGVEDEIESFRKIDYGKIRASGTKPHYSGLKLVATKSYIGECQLFSVINTRDGGLALGNKEVVHDVIREHSYVYRDIEVSRGYG